MQEFNELLEVAEKLLSPGGCPWDQKQTFFSLQPYVLEEAHEVIEAVDGDQNDQIIEELGDLLYTIIFYGKLAQKEGRFSMEDVVRGVKEKLIRRHPHVFGEVKVSHVDEIVKNWEQIKKQEKAEKKSPSDGIPPTLPALARAQKVVKRLLRSDPSLIQKMGISEKNLSEQELGEALLCLIAQAEESEIDSESALRRALTALESSRT